MLRMSHHRFSFAALSAVAALSTVAAVAGQRGFDPVEIPGSRVPSLLGRNPARIVAFRWGAGWEQIPVQVDERAVVRFEQIQNASGYTFRSLVYTDPNTFTGADPDPTFDANDEIAFMARHAGGPAGFGSPQGVLPNSRVALSVIDPITSDRRYAYLFVSDGTLDPSAGRDLVDYRFQLVSGDYRTTYDTSSGPNPERSRVVTRRYRIDFSDRWILDRASIFAGSSTGVDVLDRVKFQYQPGVCNRTTDTFSNGPGALIANIDGPVRAIRSVFGANSGRLTQRDWICYESRVLSRSYLRVHPIGGTWNFIDLSPAAVGMTYFDNLNRGGVTVDGRPDNVRTGVLDWQMVTGAQGSLTVAYVLDTDIPIGSIQRGSYYFDDVTPSWSQCTGDAFAYSASGPATGRLPNTDPLRGVANRLTIDQSFYFDGPGLTVADAESRAARARYPLEVRVQPRYRTFGAGCPSTVGTPELSAAGVPEPGQTVTIGAAPLPPSSVGVFWFGVSDSVWNGASLPLALDGFGLRGCSVLVSLDIGVDTGVNNGRAEVRVDIPADAALVGVALYQQFVGVERAGRTLRVSLSNGGALTIGG